jgi:hypothetical protein
MKKYFVIVLVFVATFSFGQTLKMTDQKLIEAFGKINYWAFNKTLTDKINPYDSLELVNDEFEKLLLKYTKSIPQTLSYEFKNLIDSGLIISTSEDGLFRIYSWDTWTGGTMHNFRNVYQFKSGDKIYSKIMGTKNGEDGVPGCFYNQINDVVSGGKTFYMAQSRAILSTALSYHNIKVFSIDNSKLNDTAKLIKTKTGVKNQLGYGIDLTASANRDKEVPEFYIEYDRLTKTYVIPLILEDSKVTTKKIRYQFKGKYFEKL